MNISTSKARISITVSDIDTSGIEILPDGNAVVWIQSGNEEFLVARQRLSFDESKLTLERCRELLRDVVNEYGHLSSQELRILDSKASEASEDIGDLAKFPSDLTDKIV